MKCLFLSNLILVQAYSLSSIHRSVLSHLQQCHAFQCLKVVFKYCYFQDTWARVQPYQVQLLRPYPPRPLQPPCPLHCSLTVPNSTASQSVLYMQLGRNMQPLCPLHTASPSSAACIFLSSLSSTFRYQI